MNVFLFSHIADIDGITPIILSKLAFKKITYKLLDNPIDSEFLTVVNNTDFSNYDYIFMTDLCISEDTLSKLDSNFVKKFKIFDQRLFKETDSKICDTFIRVWTRSRKVDVWKTQVPDYE